MTNFKNNSDNLPISGFISPHEIFKYVTQQEIYELVFGFKPKEYQYVKSPLREDSEAGCWFEYDEIVEGKLLFRDWGYGERPLDCFDLVRIHFNLPNFYQTLVFIKKTFYYKTPITLKSSSVPSIKTRKKGVIIKNRVRNFDSRDGDFWGTKYGIKKSDLFEDSVFPIDLIKIIYKNKKKEPVLFHIKDIAYSFAEFPEGRKKIYRPAMKGKYKFLTNCTKNDIGGLKHFPISGRQAVITKSYKDYRVLKNQGLNVIWFQNEGMTPDIEILKNILNGYDEIVVFFDNDATGIKASEKLFILLSTFKTNVREVKIPVLLLKENITDPSDFRAKKGQIKLTQLLKELKLINY